MLLGRRVGLESGAPLRMRVRRIAPYAVILAIGCWLLFLTGRFDFDKTAGSLGPDAWPRLILLLMSAVCAFEIVRLAFFWRGEDAAPTGMDAPSIEDDISPADAMNPNYVQAGWAFASIVLYLLMFPYAGFFLATFVFLAAFSAIAGYRRILVILPVAAILTTGFMFLFMRVIYVSLPIGIEPFSKVSLLMMKLLGVS